MWYSSSESQDKVPGFLRWKREIEAVLHVSFNAVGQETACNAGLCFLARSQHGKGWCTESLVVEELEVPRKEKKSGSVMRLNTA